MHCELLKEIEAANSIDILKGSAEPKIKVAQQVFYFREN